MLSADEDGRIAVSGVWEDHHGHVMAVVRENQLAWAEEAGFKIRSGGNGVALTYDGDPLWQVTVHEGAVQVEGLFLTPRGMVIVADWGLMVLDREEINAALERVHATPSAMLQLVRQVHLRSPRPHLGPTRKPSSCGQNVH